MRTKILSLLLLAFVGASVMQAQSRDEKKVRERMEKQAEKMAKEFDVDADWFTPLYIEYQDTISGLRRSMMPQRQRGEQQGNREANRTELTEEEAATLIENMFTVSEQEVALKRVYYAKFSEKLTAVQMIRIFAQMGGGFRQGGNQQQGGMPGGGMPGGGMPGGGFGGDF